MKRKRKSQKDIEGNAAKRLKSGGERPATASNVAQPVLASFFPRVLTLRDYLIEQLSGHPRRRKLVDAAAKCKGDNEVTASRTASTSEEGVAKLLNTVLVGLRETAEQSRVQPLSNEDIRTFTQQRSGSPGQSPTASARLSSHSDLVDFAIWLLFHKRYNAIQRPPHLLCRGYQRSTATWQNGVDLHAGCKIPGLAVMFPNEHVETIKNPLWTGLASILGGHAEKLVINLILDCAVFVPVDNSPNSYYQLSGMTISDLTPIQRNSTCMPKGNPLGNKACPTAKADERGCAKRAAGAITFVRHRMLYARPTLNARGHVRFGMRHIHVLNRYADSSNEQQTLHVMKYIFPLQLKLHNAFTSNVDSKETAQPFKDYTLREHEIAESQPLAKMQMSDDKNVGASKAHLPKRLRGQAFELCTRLRVQHERCAYVAMLNRYCPLPHVPSKESRLPEFESAKWHFSELSTSPVQVSAYCRAVLRRVLPLELIGAKDVGDGNWTSLMNSVDIFIRARRFESLTLGSVLRGLKIKNIPWLGPTGLAEDAHLSKSDFDKRRELLAELVYYIFDSFLIPLIRSNFHVTESSSHRNKLFYFRHDVWQRMTEPAMSALKSRMFEELKTETAIATLSSRATGFSQIRFLPKESGMRAVANLRRRAQVVKNGWTVLGRSINSTLAPAFNVLTYEKSTKPALLGSSLFSVSGMYSKVQQFQSTLKDKGLDNQKLYFAKVDVQSCFDNLPQSLLIKLAEEAVSVEDYWIARRSELTPSYLPRRNCDMIQAGKPLRKFVSTVSRAGEWQSFVETIETSSRTRRAHSVLVDGVLQQSVAKSEVMKLLREHLESNMIKVGKRFFRQKQGIPQGSVVSSILCNMGYADFERKHLGFLRKDEPCLLLRLIDDFLLITPSRSQAMEFLQVMHDGNTAYGITIKQEKSLVNFEATINGHRVPRCSSEVTFPYCGILLGQDQLHIAKDELNRGRGAISDSLTIEYSKIPGQTLKRKMINALKLQMHAMLFDTAHNDIEDVLSNVYQLARESAIRTYHYIRGIASLRRAAPALLLDLIKDMAGLMQAKVKSRRNKEQCALYECTVGRASIRWLTVWAFVVQLRGKQARFGRLIEQLQSQATKWRPRSQAEASLLERVVGRQGVKQGQTLR